MLRVYPCKLVLQLNRPCVACLCTIDLHLKGDCSDMQEEVTLQSERLLLPLYQVIHHAGNLCSRLASDEVRLLHRP